MATTRISDNQIDEATSAIITTLSFLNTNSVFKIPVGDEANRWNLSDGKPNLKNEKIFYKKNTGFKKFKKENFKGIYLISSKVRSFFRKIDVKKIENEYRPIDGNPTGAYIYTNHDMLTGCNKENRRNNKMECFIN